MPDNKVLSGNHINAVRCYKKSIVMKYKQDDIECVISKYQQENNPTGRYASFDYCYNYFRQSSPDALLKNMEKSCLVIGFYLASWGMFRGSSFLLGNSARYYERLIEYIAKSDPKIWSIDIDSYNKDNIDILCDIYKEVQGIIIQKGKSHLTIVTKIMLGVFGIIPAFDTFFGNTFRDMFKNECGFRRVNNKSLKFIQQFYEHNKNDIDYFSSRIFTTDFITGKKTNINYTKAKLIDMYGITKGNNSLKRKRLHEY